MSNMFTEFKREVIVILDDKLPYDELPYRFI